MSPEKVGNSTRITTLADLKAFEGSEVSDPTRRARRRVIRSGGTVVLPLSLLAEEPVR